mgnify:FL=1
MFIRSSNQVLALLLFFISLGIFRPGLKIMAHWYCQGLMLWFAQCFAFYIDALQQRKLSS